METPPDVTPFYLDKAFCLLFLVPLFAFINAKFGLNLDATVIVGMLLPVVAYIVMHKWKTAQLAKARIEGKTAADAVNSDKEAVAELSKDG